MRRLFWVPLLLAGFLIAAVGPTTPADALIYFQGDHDSGLGRATDDGSKVDPNFLPDGQPSLYDGLFRQPVASDGKYLYYATYSGSGDSYGISRVSTDLGGKPETVVPVHPFDPGETGIFDIEVANASVYFLIGGNGGQYVGRVDKDGSSFQPHLVSTGTFNGCDLCGASLFLAVDPSVGVLYFDVGDIGPSYARGIARASLDGTGSPTLLLTSDNFLDSITAGGGWVYWEDSPGNGAPEAISRVDSTGAMVDRGWITGPVDFGLQPFAVNSQYIYFNYIDYSAEENDVARASLDGTVENYKLFGGGAGVAIDGLSAIPRIPLSSNCQAAIDRLKKAKTKLKRATKKLAKAKDRVKHAAPGAAERLARKQEKKAAGKFRKAKDKFNSAEHKQRHAC